MLSEAKQNIFQARWRKKNCQKLVQSERERRCNMLSAAKKGLFRRVGATKTVKNWFNLKGKADEICRFRMFQNQEGKANYELMSVPFSVSFHMETFWRCKKKIRSQKLAFSLSFHFFP